MNNPMRKAFGEYLAKQNGMMLNAADAFAAGWDAGIYRMMDLLDVPSNEKAPDESEKSLGATDKAYPFQKYGCNCASPSDQYHGWKCSVTDGECVFLHPNAVACAKRYGEGPLAKYFAEDKKAPDEGATSSQRKGDITTHSIADGR